MKNQLRLIAAILLFASCSSTRKDAPLNMVDVLASSASDTTQFKIDDLLNVDDYDSFLFVPPYTVLEGAERHLGVKLELIEESGIEFRDDVYLLCLLKENKITDWYFLTRDSINFEDVSNFRKYERKHVLSLIYNSTGFELLD